MLDPTPTFDPIPDRFADSKVWLDGKLVTGAESAVSIMTLTLHYGLGAFEGVRSYDGKGGPAVFRLREHIARLHTSASMLRMEIPFSVDALCEACTTTLSANGLRAGYLRPLAFVDDGKRGLGATNNRIRTAVMTWPWGAYLGEEGLERGIRATVSGWSRMNPRSFLPKGKICGQYVNSILAKRGALSAGYDEAILLDDAGFVSEASGENIFLVRDGAIVTPPKSSPILEGITRDTIIKLAHSLDIPVIEETFTRGALYAADEVFFTGTAAEVTPVREIDDRTIGLGARGPITERLQSLYFDVVNGRTDEHSDWLYRYDA